MTKITVLGAGTWGIALARILANAGHRVTVWSALPAELEALQANGVHKNLPGVVLPDTLVYQADIAKACADAGVLLFAVPSVFVRSVAAQVKPCIAPGQIIVDVAKGVEPDTLYTMTQVIRDELGADAPVELVALSGPTHAEEVARDMPTSIVSACGGMDTAARVQMLFEHTCLRTYTNPDILGVELCGALKNVIALGAGIARGLGYGDNARAALITRGMVEITRLGVAMGCRERTFQGLAGVGDLIVTASSEHSRNNRCGQLIGRGVPVAEAVKQVGMVVEGINALPAAVQLAEKYRVDMPICRAIDAIVRGGASAEVVAAGLMRRQQRPEMDQDRALRMDDTVW